jgi:hypothetical protein
MGEMEWMVIMYNAYLEPKSQRGEAVVAFLMPH